MISHYLYINGLRDNMIYLKKFNNESDYLAYRDGKRYGKPNVSFSIDNKAVYYNYPAIDTNGFEFVNLGLPSGTLWATCNVGADKPSDTGLYFQWGDISGYTKEQIGTGSGQKKFSSDKSDYKWYNGSTYTKYVTTGETLELEDDSAHANMEGDWHMPTPNQIKELISTANTTSSWTTQNGVNGRLFVSNKNKSKSLFIPAAGIAWEKIQQTYGSTIRVWSSMLITKDLDHGFGLYSTKTQLQLDTGFYRYCGRSVRGVI